MAATDHSVCTGLATTCCGDTSQRQIASCVNCGNFVKIFVSATEFCRRNKSQIRSSVINLAGITNLNMKGKTKRIVVVVVKRRHLANGLLQVYVATFTEHYSQ